MATLSLQCLGGLTAKQVAWAKAQPWYAGWRMHDGKIKVTASECVGYQDGVPVYLELEFSDYDALKKWASLQPRSAC